MWGLAARCSKASKQARLMERKVALFQMPATGGEGWQISVQRPTSPTDKQAGERIYRQAGAGNGGVGVWCYMQKQHSHNGLTSIILNVLGTVSLHFQGPFVPISLWSILRIVKAHVLGTVCSFM